MLLENNKSDFISEEINNEEFKSAEMKSSAEYYEDNKNDDEKEDTDYKELRTKDEIDEDGRFNLEKSKKNIGTDFNFKREIVWKMVFLFIILHSLALYGVYLCFTEAKLATSIYLFIMTHVTGLGITAAAHRLWAHRTYKARLPLKIFLLICQTVNGQESLWKWIRDHRLHHRYSDTDGDPHNAQRGFIFSHIGWQVTKRHPLIKELGKTTDLSDIEADPLVMFQKRYYKTLLFVFGFLIPVLIPVYFWNESFWVSTITCFFLRYVYQLNVTWSLNSFAHTHGSQPYDKTIYPIESTAVALFTLGEGWHNFHHAFPWDYRMGEWGGFWNLSATFINLMHYIGQAYDLKMASPAMIKKRMERTGDGTTYKQLNHKAISKQL